MVCLLSRGRSYFRASKIARPFKRTDLLYENPESIAEKRFKMEESNTATPIYVDDVWGHLMPDFMHHKNEAR